MHFILIGGMKLCLRLDCCCSVVEKSCIHREKCSMHYIKNAMTANDMKWCLNNESNVQNVKVHGFECVYYGKGEQIKVVNVWLVKIGGVISMRVVSKCIKSLKIKYEWYTCVLLWFGVLVVGFRFGKLCSVKKKCVAFGVCQTWCI